MLIGRSGEGGQKGHIHCFVCNSKGLCPPPPPPKWWSFHSSCWLTLPGSKCLPHPHPQRTNPASTCTTDVCGHFSSSCIIVVLLNLFYLATKKACCFLASNQGTNSFKSFLRDWPMRIKLIAQGHYCHCQQIWTRDLTVESSWSYPISNDSSCNLKRMQSISITYLSILWGGVWKKDGKIKLPMYSQQKLKHNQLMSSRLASTWSMTVLPYMHNNYYFQNWNMVLLTIQPELWNCNL